MKLVVREAETDALRQLLARFRVAATSRVSTVEVPRALTRAGERAASESAVPELFQRVMVLELDASVADAAGRLGPATLRSLDAIHLASALALRPELEALVTYDDRLARAARAFDLVVESPGHEP